MDNGEKDFEMRLTKVERDLADVRELASSNVREVADTRVEWRSTRHLLHALRQTQLEQSLDMHELKSEMFIVKNEVTQTRLELRTEIQATRDELRAEMQAGLGGLRSELGTGLGEVRSELGTGLCEVRSELGTGLGEVRSELQTSLGDVRSDMQSGFERLEAGITELAASVKGGGS